MTTEAQQTIDDTNALIDHIEAKLSRTVAIGDIFSRSWGYDQTNVNFYVVTAVSKTGKTATFMEITAKRTDDSHVIADPSAASCERCMRAIRPLVKASGETVWRHVHDGEQRCNTYRDGDTRTAQPEIFKRVVKVSSYNGQLRANYNSYSDIHEWDGAPEYVTPSGFGH